jgi:hypothetical protein
MVQKEGKAKIPAAWPTTGIIRVTQLAGTIESLSKAVQSVEAGALSVHLDKDFDATGAKQYTLIHLPAAALVDGALDLSGQNEVSCVFDEIRETGTTVALAGLTIWL